MSRRVLIVCTGNICRSPMAELLLREALDAEGVEGVAVSSRGLMAQDGWLMTAEAKLALAKLEIDAQPRQACQLQDEDVARADLILVMEDWHKKDLLMEYPQAARKTYLLKEYGGGHGGVDDPYGADLETYAALARELKRVAAGVARRLRGAA